MNSFLLAITILSASLIALTDLHQAVASLASQPNLIVTSIPRLKDQSGEFLVDVSVGQLVIISVQVTNGLLEAKHVTTIIEVRDSSGVSQLIEFHQGILKPDGRVEVGISWMPDLEGEYELRCFLISDFQTAEVFSGVKNSIAIIT
jgi:hypothetical protein